MTIRGSVSKSGFNAGLVPIVGTEVVLVSILVGLAVGSAWAFIGTLLAFGAITRSRLAVVMVWGFSLLWAAGAFWLVRWLGLGWGWSGPASLLAFICGYGVHHSGFQYVRDITTEKQLEL